DYYTQVEKFLTKPKRDRLARDPDPIRLSSHRSVEEITSLIVKRLEVLYAEFGAVIDPANPLFPFTPAQIQKLIGLQTRDVLGFIHQHHEKCVRDQRWLNPKFSPEDIRIIDSPPLPLEQRWNDFLAAFTAPSLEDESELASLLAW